MHVTGVASARLDERFQHVYILKSDFGALFCGVCLLLLFSPSDI